MLELLVQKLENEKSADHNCYRTLQLKMPVGHLVVHVFQIGTAECVNCYEVTLNISAFDLMTVAFVCRFF